MNAYISIAITFYHYQPQPSNPILKHPLLAFGWNFAQEIKDIHYFNNCDEKIFLGEKNSQTIL